MLEIALLMFVAVIPPACFMYFIYWMDRYEPESMKNILTAMLVGAWSAIPAIIAYESLSWIPIFQTEGLIGAFLEQFLLVASFEEFFKFYFIYLFLKNKPYFKSLNDGIVYYGAGALGFALFENIFYVLDYGFATGVMRAFTSIPVHTFCGVMIGFHAGLARFTTSENPQKIILRGLLIAYLTHALYNTLLSAENLLALLLIPLLLSVYIFGYKTLLKGQTLSIALSSGQAVFKTKPGEVEQPQYSQPAYIKPTPSIDLIPAPPPIISSQSVPSPVTAPGQATKATAFTFHKKKTIVKPYRSSWKIYVSRTIFTLCGLAFLLIFVDPEETIHGKFDLLLGMLVITIIPIIVGILLEFSYRQRRQIISDYSHLNLPGKNLLNNMSYSPLPPPYPTVEKPQIYNYRLDEVQVNKFGQRYLPPKKETWKAVLSRLLFALIIVLWLLVYFSYDSKTDTFYDLFFGMIFLTIIPSMIALMLEFSYQRRKRTIILLD